MAERDKPDLSQVEPIGRAPDAEDAASAEISDAPRLGRAAAIVEGSAPAAGVEAEALERVRSDETNTSAETEEQLEQLRRG